MTFISEVLDSVTEVESPRLFWYWSALAALSAVVKDNVWHERGGAYKLFPNIFVMLHADSGLKKGPPVGFAKDLVKRVNNTRIISGRSSIQGILKELGTAYTIPGGKVINKSYGFIVASEFSSSLVNDPAAMTILTDLFDRQYNEGEWRSLLKMETFNLKDPTITMLVATNEAHFEDFIATKDVHGGFVGRMFIIAESQVQKLNPLMRKLDRVPDRARLVDYLKQVAALNGEMQVEESVIKIYEDWYYDFYNTVREQKVKDETGTINRFGDSVLKVAMLLSLSEQPELYISETAMREAITICEQLIGNVRKTTTGKRGKSSLASQKGMVINELTGRDNHMVSRAQLLKKYWMHMSADDLNSIIESLGQAGIITMEQHGGTIVYVMPETIAKEFKHFNEGKNK